MTERPLLTVRNLRKYYPVKAGLGSASRTLKAVDDVSFDIYEGETLGLVGESGCGKTTTGRVLVRLVQPTAGQMIMRIGESEVDLGLLSGDHLRVFRRHIQMIFQDPYSSLSPRMRVRDLLAEPIHALEPNVREDEVQERITALAEAVGLNKAQLGRYPHAFSGGQRQRICIARALAVRPRLIVCDEPVSALDVSVRAQIINLLKDLQQEFKLTYLFIAHDLALVENISARTAVMYAGKIVEQGPTEELFANPQHPYTQALLRAVPVPDPSVRTSAPTLKGEVAEASNLPSGCAFHPRCPVAFERCPIDVPALLSNDDTHFTACHLVHP